jgi:lysophospholipase L1-like esterase
MHDTRVYAVPGANIDTFINMINTRKLDVSTYRIILIHLGTNDAYLATPYRVARNMSVLVDVIMQWNPWVRVAISGIMVRYEHKAWEEDLRRSTNDEIGYMCGSRAIIQMKTWDCVLDRGVPIRGDYAFEGIHLSRRGADKIKHYMEGTIIQLKGMDLG